MDTKENGMNNKNRICVAAQHGAKKEKAMTQKKR